MGGNARNALKKAASKAGIIDDGEKNTKYGDSSKDETDAVDNTHNTKSDDDKKVDGETKSELSSENAAANFVAIAGNATKKAIGNARNSLKKAASKAGIIDDDRKKTNDDNDGNGDEDEVAAF